VSTTPRYSLVVPAYNEAAYLPRLLDSVDAARAAYRGGAANVEVVVADNASTDATAAIAAARGCVVAPVAKRAIAAARNGGAAVARGAVLCFVDADMRIHAATFDAIDAALTERAVAGATGVRLERMSVGLAATFALLWPFIALSGMDTGVVFVRRADFDAIGGYDERRLYAEDVDFLWRLRRLGARRGQRLVRAPAAKAVASTRKFDRYGDWHYFTQILRLVPSLFGAPAKRREFVRKYWYDDR
jgi:glycosyltransferase involved in cell wall biosynthesis